MILGLYRGLTTAALPLVLALLWERARRGKEEWPRLGERRGIAGRPRPEGRLVWAHAASVGEAISLLPLVERIQARPGHTVLLTTGTVTSARLMAERLPEGAIHHYVPLDRPTWVDRFLDHWRPDLVLWAESEFWPNMLAAIHDRDIPLVLVNGRISERSFARWSRHPGLIGRMLANFSLCMGQSAQDAERLAVLGAPKVCFPGNLKLAAPPLPADEARLAAERHALDGRPCWLAASTHPGEDVLAGRVHQILASRHGGLLTIIVPRHPHRGPDIARDLAAMGLRAALRSAGQAATETTDVLVADTMGELGLFYRLAPLVFVGKSLVGEGGQNPLEAARLGALVLFGPHMENFAELSASMLSAGAALRVETEAGLAETLSALLSDPSRVAAGARLAQDFALAQAHILDAVLAELECWLAPGEGRGKG